MTGRNDSSCTKLAFVFTSEWLVSRDTFSSVLSLDMLRNFSNDFRRDTSDCSEMLTWRQKEVASYVHVLLVHL